MIACALLVVVRAGVDEKTLLTDAHAAWDTGNYTAALRGYQQLLTSPDADALLEPIALQTGELHVTTELTSDGAAPQFSPDGRYITYETGIGLERRTRLVAARDGADAGELRGFAASFAADASAVAYLRSKRDPAVVEADAAWRQAPAAERTLRLTALNEALAASADLVLRDIGRGTEIVLDTAGLHPSGPRAAAGGIVLFSARPDGAPTEPSQIYAAAAGRPPRRLTQGEDDKVLLDVAAGGAAALFTLRPLGLAPRAASSRFGILSLPGGAWRAFDGRAPSFAADGRSFVYVSPEAGGNRLLVASTSDPSSISLARHGREPVDNPALSPDGTMVAFQMMPLHDWEIYVVGRDGTGERRVTREIQHDVLPRFLTGDRLLGAIGEARHRRSYLYELPPDASAPAARRRLFHNNTVRTIAPEYSWAPAPGGGSVLITAERDGDTVSPARGVYLVDLARRVTLDALRVRVGDNLRAEEHLAATGKRLFAPLEDEVRRIVEGASVGRVFAHEKALFDFDSKHITRPGNGRAAEYLFAAYRSFGYQPEYQTFDVRSALDGRTSNVLATLPGTRHPELVYVVSSHYDSAADGPGADDNSSGTAALLETARLLARHPQPATIVFASFTGEEAGLLGSREFVRRAQAAGTRIVGALNNDMIGWTNDHRLDNTIRYSNRGIRDVQHAAAMLFTRLITYDALYYRNTDAAAYYEAYGDIVGGIGSYPVLGNPHYHQPHDVLETVNHQLVTEVAKTTAATLVLLASSPSRIGDLKVESARNGVATVSWSPAREAGVTGYVLEHGLPGRPLRRMAVPTPAARIEAASGSIVLVRAINERGLESWDSAKVVIP